MLLSLAQLLKCEFQTKKRLFMKTLNSNGPNVEP